MTYRAGSCSPASSPTLHTAGSAAPHARAARTRPHVAPHAARAPPPARSVPPRRCTAPARPCYTGPPTCTQHEPRPGVRAGQARSLAAQPEVCLESNDCVYSTEQAPYCSSITGSTCLYHRTDGVLGQHH